MRSKLEKETVVTFNEAEPVAEIYTHNAKWKKKLSQLHEDSPDKCIFQYSNEDGGVAYTVDKSMVSLRKPYSEEQREAVRKMALRDKRIENTRKQEE